MASPSPKLQYRHSQTTMKKLWLTNKSLKFPNSIGVACSSQNKLYRQKRSQSRGNVSSWINSLTSRKLKPNNDHLLKKCQARSHYLTSQPTASLPETLLRTRKSRDCLKTRGTLCFLRRKNIANDKPVGRIAMPTFTNNEDKVVVKEQIPQASKLDVRCFQFIDEQQVVSQKQEPVPRKRLVTEELFSPAGN